MVKLEVGAGGEDADGAGDGLEVPRPHDVGDHPPPAGHLGAQGRAPHQLDGPVDQAQVGGVRLASGALGGARTAVWHRGGDCFGQGASVIRCCAGTVDKAKGKLMPRDHGNGT